MTSRTCGGSDFRLVMLHSANFNVIGQLQLSREEGNGNVCETIVRRQDHTYVINATRKFKKKARCASRIYLPTKSVCLLQNKIQWVVDTPASMLAVGGGPPSTELLCDEGGLSYKYPYHITIHALSRKRATDSKPHDMYKIFTSRPRRASRWPSSPPPAPPGLRLGSGSVRARSPASTRS